MKKPASGALIALPQITQPGDSRLSESIFLLVPGSALFTLGTTPWFCVKTTSLQGSTAYDRDLELKLSV